MACEFVAEGCGPYSPHHFRVKQPQRRSAGCAAIACAFNRLESHIFSTTYRSAKISAAGMNRKGR
jgi:hypothetical protein